MKIVDLLIEPLYVPLTQPFGISRGSNDSMDNLLVTIVLKDGTRGYGEAAPLPVFNGETLSDARMALNEMRAGLIGADVRQWRRVSSDLPSSMKSALCAAETAMLDALCRSIGLPMWSFFGGMLTSLESDITIPICDPQSAGEAATRAVAMGFSRIKLKVGSPRDAVCLHAVCEAAPTAELMLDGNAGLTVNAAIDLFADHRSGIILFEQPVPRDDLDGLREIREKTGIPIAADESACDCADVLRLFAGKAADVVNIKLMKMGIVEALDVAALCRRLGLGLMIGGMLETELAMSTSACFAAGLGGFDFVDLDTPLFMAEHPLRGGYAQTGPTLDLSTITSGHGVQP